MLESIFSMSLISGLVKPILAMFGIKGAVATIISKISGLTLVLVGGLATALVLGNVSYHVVEIEGVEQIVTTKADIIATVEDVKLIGGYCGMSGNYSIALEAQYSVDGESIELQKNLFDDIAVTFGEANLTSLNVKSFTVNSESTTFGCNVDWSELRDIAKWQAMAEFAFSSEYIDILSEVEENTKIAIQDIFETDSITVIDDDNSKTNYTNVGVSLRCFAINENKEYVKTC